MGRFRARVDVNGCLQHCHQSALPGAKYIHCHQSALPGAKYIHTHSKQIGDVSTAVCPILHQPTEFAEKRDGLLNVKDCARWHSLHS